MISDKKNKGILIEKRSKYRNISLTTCTVESTNKKKVIYQGLGKTDPISKNNNKGKPVANIIKSNIQLRN